MRCARLSQNLRRLKENGRGATLIFLINVEEEPFRAGTELELGDAVDVMYDHKVLSAFPVLLYPGYYVLARDLDPHSWMSSGELVGTRTTTVH